MIGSGDQSEMLQRLVSRVSSLELAVAAAEARRRELHNQLVQLRGNVRSCPLRHYSVRKMALLLSCPPFLIFACCVRNIVAVIDPSQPLDPGLHRTAKCYI